MPDEYQTIVIGGGSGGLAFARRAASYGRRVVVFEDAELGGTCVNRGCVPKKIMWHAAQLAHQVEDARGYGFDVTVTGHDWTALKAARDAYVERLNGIYAHNLEKDGAELIRARARFVDAHTVNADGRTYGAEHVVIATGGVPAVPAFEGAALGITSDGFFELERRPERVAIVGAGYVAAELAGVLHALGSRVEMFLRGNRPLRSFDPLLGETLADHMRTDGITLHAGSEVVGLSGRANAVEVAVKGGTGHGPYGAVIWAIGRRPVTDGLGLEAAGVRTDADGHVVTDLYQASSVPTVFALGDVSGRLALTPVAIAAGRRLADRLYGGAQDRHLDYENVPTVVFSHPPIGTVGLSEPAARERHGDAVRVHVTRFMPLYYGATERKLRAHMKLVTLGDDGRIVGCHVIGDGADEMLQGFAVAVRMGATKKDFDDTVAIHPTSAEEMVTMK